MNKTHGVSPDSVVNKLVSIKFDVDYPVIGGSITVDGTKYSVFDLCKLIDSGLEFIYESANVLDISVGDYIESYSTFLRESEPQRVNEIIYSGVSDNQLNILYSLGSLTVSKDTEVFTDSGYVKARELGLKNRILIDGCFEYIYEIGIGDNSTDFVGYNVSENFNYYASTEGEKILIRNSD